MASGIPGTGKWAGRKRERYEAPRRRGRLSYAELATIRSLALDQPGSDSHEALEHQIERLARVLRRSPYAVRRALHAQRAVGRKRDEILAAIKSLGDPLAFLEGLLQELVRSGAAPAGDAQDGVSVSRFDNSAAPGGVERR